MAASSVLVVTPLRSFTKEVCNELSMVVPAELALMDSVTIAVEARVVSVVKVVVMLVVNVVVVVVVLVTPRDAARTGSVEVNVDVKVDSAVVTTALK